jgi:hypothetical protein
MKTAPTVGLVEKADTVLLPDLPDEVALAMRDIAGAAREGLLALSVAAGMAVMQAMFEVEITEACGPKGKHSRRQTPLPEGPDEHRAHVPKSNYRKIANATAVAEPVEQKYWASRRKIEQGQQRIMRFVMKLIAPHRNSNSFAGNGACSGGASFIELGAEGSGPAWPDPARMRTRQVPRAC